MLQKVNDWCSHFRLWLPWHQVSLRPPLQNPYNQNGILRTMRVNFGCNELMNDLEYCLSSVFLPSLFGVRVSATEQKLFGLPLKYGGLGVINPIAIANHCFDSSIRSTLFLWNDII